VIAMRGTGARGRRILHMKRQALLLCWVLVAAGAAGAQAPPAPATPPAETAPPVTASECSPAKPVPPRGTIAPEGTTTGQAGESLGDRLARSDGVLCPPPGVDPQIRAPTPDAGNMPVIPPPGSPGGNPAPRPK